MIGAIIGDIVGSRFEWDNHRSKDFELFTPKCFATDDSIMSLAIAEALMRAKPDFSDLGERPCAACRKWAALTPTAAMAGIFSDGCMRTTRSPTTALAMARPCA